MKEGSEKKKAFNAFEAMEITEYKDLISGRFLFITAMRMLGTLAGWWMYELTNLPLAIGLIGLAEVVPALSLALYSGHRVDISEKRILLLRCIIGYLVAVLVLTFFAFGYGYQQFSKTVLIAGIYGVIFFTGFLRSFTGPTFSALIGTIVPKHLLANATSWSQGSWLTASVCGHAISGFLIAWFGVKGTLLVIVFLVVASLFFLKRILPKPILNVPGAKPTWESVKEGLRFVFHTKVLLGAMSLDMFAVLFGGAVAMIPVFAKDILHVGPIGFGWLNGAMDIGAMLSIATLTFFPLLKNQGKKMMICVGIFGICIIVFALSKSFLLSFLVLMVAGIVDGVSVVVRGTVMQLLTPDNMRGRVSSVSSMFVNSSNELGQFESGIAARIFGVVPSVIFGGCMTLAVVLITWFKAPTLKKFTY